MKNFIEYLKKQRYRFLLLIFIGMSIIIVVTWVKIKKIDSSINNINQNIISSNNCTNEISVDEYKKIRSIYQEEVNDALNRVDIAMAILGTVVSIISIISFLVNTKSMRIEQKLEEKMENIDKIDEEVKQLKILRNFIKGYTFAQSKNYQYAIDEYMDGLKNENSELIRIHLAAVYADISRVSNKKEYIDYAIDCLKEECDKSEDDKIKAEYNYTKACIYGMKAKMISSEDIENKNTFLNKSIDYFKKAIREDKMQGRFYANMALSNYYLGNEDDMIKNLQQAKQLYDISIDKKEEDVFSVFQEDLTDRKFSSNKITYEKWKKYRKEVGVKEESEAEFKKRINDDGDLNEIKDEINNLKRQVKKLSQTLLIIQRAGRSVASGKR